MSNFWEADPVATSTKGVANFWDADPVAEPSVAADIAKSGGIGLAKGGIGIAGMAGDVRNLLSSGVDFAADKIGASPEAAQRFKDTASSAAKFLPTPVKVLADAPSSGDIQKGIESVTGEFYKPKTVAGEYAQTAGEFAPAVLGGGEGLMAKLLTRVAAPAIASETAGQLTKGTAAEPYARVAGAVTAGGLASALSKAKTAAAPTVEELKDAARSQYQHPDVKAVQIHPDAVKDLRNVIKSDLESGTNSGFRAANERKTFSAIDELANPSQSSARAAGMPATIDDLDSVRKVLGRVSKEKDAIGAATSDAAAASRAMGHIDDFLTSLKQPQLIAGDASKAVPILQDARGNWGAAKRAEEVQTRAQNAKDQAGATFAGGNINNATRQQFTPLVKNDFRKAPGFNDEEKAALRVAANGTVPGNLARLIGKLGPDAGMKGHTHLAAAFASGGATIPLSAAMFGSKLAGDAMKRRDVRSLDELLRSRSPLAQQVAAATPMPVRQSGGQSALVQALLASAAPRLQVPQTIANPQ